MKNLYLIFRINVLSFNLREHSLSTQAHIYEFFRYLTYHFCHCFLLSIGWRGVKWVTFSGFLFVVQQF